MAQTVVTNADGLTQKLYDEKLFRDTIKESFFNKFMGADANSIIHTKTQLEKQQGGNVTFGIRMRLSPDQFVVGENAVEGNEQSLTTYNQNVVLEELALAVRDKGRLTRKRAVWMVDEESRGALLDAGAELIDQICFDVLTGTSSVASDKYGAIAINAPSKTFYKTSAGIAATATLATAKSSITVAADSKLTPSMINSIATWAKTGGDRGQTPLRPIKVDGRMYYVLLVHPDVMYDLYEDSTFQQAMREAEVRGKENPLFHGSKAIWRNVVIHEHENIPIGTDAGGGAIPFAHNVLMGAQAGIWAWGRRPELVPETFDYKRQHGFAFDFIAGMAKTEFNSKDYGCVSVFTSRTNIAGL